MAHKLPLLTVIAFLTTTPPSTAISPADLLAAGDAVHTFAKTASPLIDLGIKGMEALYKRTLKPALSHYLEKRKTRKVKVKRDNAVYVNPLRASYEIEKRAK